MAKKPASPKPDAGQSVGSLEQAAEAYDRDIAPASFKDPIPPNAYDFPPSREEFDALTARVDALAELARLNYGKVI